MPFTPSHAVVALAFSNGRIPAAAVAVGAMVPDVGLYLPVRWARESTHSLLGVVTVDLLLGALGLLLWSVLLAPAWRDLAPWIVRVRLRPPPRRPRGARAWTVTLLLAAAGLVIGSASHVLWDGFTHLGGPFVAAAPFLQQQFGPFPGYKWAQYASGVLGLLGLAIGAAVWYVTRRPHPIKEDGRGPARLAAWTAVLAAAIVPAGIVLAGTGLDPFEEEYRSYVVDAAILVVSWTAVALVVVALLWRLAGLPVPRPEAGADPS
ncbi:DUF4184 family protein [Rathayibacter sp. VKM Ac-2803]|uniref:DUF4184 family protein n=1 Tax=unclassified Rathayibacter TaxID=2609250 RepID=UPI001356F11D|nr:MULTISPECIES: DUF4184 family protein [unclassified Rathayibacter]MWV48496.1 DUF4184 family protein [Rathayibacter sp. VKM Ac-2803]MWV60166.1 DUF4184 family protein [Rathayibacter sp. VKM Ac-2754]